MKRNMEKRAATVWLGRIRVSPAIGALAPPVPRARQREFQRQRDGEHGEDGHGLIPSARISLIVGLRSTRVNALHLVSWNGKDLRLLNPGRALHSYHQIWGISHDSTARRKYLQARQLLAMVIAPTRRLSESS